MWPSMETTPRERIQAPSSTRQIRERALLDWAQASQGEVSEDDDLIENEKGKVKDMRKEMDKLERWLASETDEHSMREDPWKSAVSTQALSSSPTALEFGQGTRLMDTPRQDFGNKFDDDFTVFVSAPPRNTDAEEEQGNSGRSTPEIERASSLNVPGSAGSLYRSLGSVSDFGENDENGDGDDGLPSQAEIQEMSQKIFGKSKLAASPGKEVGPGITDSVDEDYEMGSFDLTKVLGALKGMKEEISMIENEDERRKAAAKVALGLVYGLEE
jgi:hypothetical protein